MKRPSCLLIAGEKSGEEHLLSFFPELQSLLPGYDFFGVGGDDLKKRGVELLHHLNEFSSWGYSEVFEKIPFYLKARKDLLRAVDERQCRVAILVDFQTFNMQMAKALHKREVKVLYIVAPQAWAWKSYRVEALKKSVHTLFCIIPFEKKWFQDRGLTSVINMRHPLVHHYSQQLTSVLSRKKSENRTPKRILLLPGSRRFEVNSLLPTFLNTIEELSKVFELEVGILKASSVKEEMYAGPVRGYLRSPYGPPLKNFTTVEEALGWADIALAASGTVTLATGLFAVPTIVCYKTSLLNEFIYHTFVTYRGPISLTNIVHTGQIANLEGLIFPELLQNQVSTFNLKKILIRWLTEAQTWKELQNTLFSISARLSGDDVPIPQTLKHEIESSYENQLV